MSTLAREAPHSSSRRERRASRSFLALALAALTAGAVDGQELDPNLPQAPDLQEIPALPLSPITGQGPFAGLERQPWDRLEREHRIDGNFLWSRLAGGLGSSYSATMRWRQPLAEKQHLVELAIPFRWSNYQPLPSERGVGDVRLQYYWMGRADLGGDGALRGWAPTLNVVFPSGQEEKALGFGDYLIMPGVTTTHSLSRTVSLQTTLSYAQSLGPILPGGHPEIPIPSVKSTALELQDVKALWLEPRFLFEPRGWLLDWIEFTPDLFSNFDGQKKTALTAKTSIGRVLTPNFSINATVWFPLNAGNNTLTTMWGFGISLWQ